MKLIIGFVALTLLTSGGLVVHNFTVPKAGLQPTITVQQLQPTITGEQLQPATVYLQ